MMGRDAAMLPPVGLMLKAALCVAMLPSTYGDSTSFAPVGGNTSDSGQPRTLEEAKLIIHEIAKSEPLCYASPLDFPTPIALNYSCDPGYYCPNTTVTNLFSLPQVCPPSLSCIEDRLKGQYCPPQGPYEPMLCPAGHYCPDWTQLHECPAGTFCILGTTKPKKCPWPSDCPAGTDVRRYYGGIALSIVIDITLAAMFAWFWCSRLPAAGKPVGVAKLSLASADADTAGYAGGSDRGDKLLGLLEDHEGDSSERETAAGLGAHAGPVQAAAHEQLMEGFHGANQQLSVQFDFEGIKWSLPSPSNRVILSDVEGGFKPARISALMGPSGAGKTSLFRVLLGKVEMDEGSLRINGHETTSSKYKKVLGFVPQDDIMIRELTVRDNIAHSARVRLPSSWSQARIQKHVDAVITVLGLDAVAEQPIGDENARGISGGQRKRVNIGIELASAPAALFLDEPTSGLDATAALDLMKTLRGIADLGITVVAILHQPRVEIFRAFDDLLLLEAGGRAAYVGPQQHIEEYFQGLGYTVPRAHNPADDLLDLVAGRTPAGMEGKIGKRASGSIGAADTEDGTRLATAGYGAGLPKLPNLFEERRQGHKLSEIWHRVGASWLSSRLAAHAEGPSGAQSSAGQAAFAAVASSMTGTAVHSQASEQDTKARQDASSMRGSLQHRESLLSGKSTSTALRTREAEETLVNRISEERGASFLAQVYYCGVRSIYQQIRTWDSFVLEVGVSCLAGGTMGSSIQILPEIFRGVLKPPYALISPSPLPTILPSLGLDIALATAVAAAPAAVKMFSEERAVYYREASSGHHPLAYFLGKVIVIQPRLAISALHFTALFHCLARPTTEFWMLYSIILLLYFCVYGLAILCSMVVRRENAALLGLIASLVAATMCGFGPSITEARKWHTAWALDTSFARWSNEAFFSLETQMYQEVFDISVIADFWGYTLDRVEMDLLLMTAIGLVYLILAFVLLVALDRDKQK